jgi:steroid 5-alpha reductase family enzyme
MNTTPFGHMLEVSLWAMGVTWLLSIVTKECSWIDRWWSTAPPIFATYVAWYEDFSVPRLNLMAALIVLWGARLTFNFVRKGGFAPGGEDYRWAVVRERAGPVGFQVLNIVFVSVFQCWLIWAFTSPVHTAWEHRVVPLGTWDYVVAGVFLLFWLGEVVADEQMWAFQQDKKARLARGEDIAQPFYREGLYRLSRHPNYACEIGMWWVFYGFAVTASGEWWHWTLAGVVAFTVLFEGSVRLTEEISASKYPAYADYQREVPRIFPLPRRTSS